jgi:Cathepsin propeptide inhibitor domain (I29)
MKFSLVLVLVFIAAVVAEHDFDDFRRRNRKHYKNAEEATLRKGVFLRNAETVDSHNKKFEAGLVSFTMEVNQFTDLLKSEFKKNYTGVIPPLK